MVLVVEDGTGKTNADAYDTLVAVDTYNTSHANNSTYSALSDSDKEKAIRLATQYLDNNFRNRWKGVRTTKDQSLAYPRAGVEDYDGYVFDSDVIPQVLKDAMAELAILSGTGTSLMPNLTSPGTIKSKRSRIDVIETSTEYMGGRSQIAWFRLIDNLLRDLITSSDRIVRA